MLPLNLSDTASTSQDGSSLEFIAAIAERQCYKISLWRRPALMVEDGAFSHKIDYIKVFYKILNPNGHPNRITGSKVTVDFAHWWSFSDRGSTINKATSYSFINLSIFTIS